MAHRIVIVPKGSKVLQDRSTVILHTYANGDVLVRTEMNVDDSQTHEETPVAQGVQLEGVTDEILDSIRDRLPESGGGKAEQEFIHAYIELIGPIDSEWLNTLTQLGIEILQYQPIHTYLCYGSIAAFAEAARQPFVLHIVPLTDILKPRPEKILETGSYPVWIVVRGNPEDAPRLIESLSSPPDVEIDPEQEIDRVDFYLRIKAVITAVGQDQLLQHPNVLAIEPYEPPRLEDEVANLIIAGQYNWQGQPFGSYLQWLEDRGLNGEGVTIGIVDGGVDTSHEAFDNRIRDLTGRKSWHGTFVAGHAAGRYLREKDNQQFIYGLGVAPAANLLVQDNQRTPTALCRETVTTPAPSGIPGIIQNNSWGAGTRSVMTYGSLEASYDQLVRNADPDSPQPKSLTICFSSGNSGTAGLTRPKAAKNVIVTGNSENYRPDVGKDQSDSIQEIYSGPHASSHGNCGDGRIRPHIVIAGEWTASANYDSRPGQKEYISPKLTWGGGSSGASPKTAGACALLVQWWRQHNAGQDPSPAMLRSLIVNGAEPLKSGGPIPNPIQGWGRLNLENVLADVRRVYVDQSILLKQRGEERHWDVQIDDVNKPVKITLAWTDPPGAIGSGTATIPAIVNKLALRVEVNGQLYRGNQFQGGWSYPNGSSEKEGWDNLQNVYLPAGEVQGKIRVSVVALDITTDCLTGKITTPQQDFALVISNAHLDGGSHSTDVFLGLDDTASNPPKNNNPDDFWADNPLDSDRDALNVDWWNTIDAQAGNSSDNGGSNSQENVDTDRWWLANDVVWAESEIQRQPPPPSENKALMQALQTGINIVADSGNKAALVSKIAVESGDAGESEIPSLSPTLKRLIIDWEKSRTSADKSPSFRRQAALLIVGSGTRISQEDLSMMRCLSFTGEIYLVSDYAPILVFLAQRLHRTVGVHFRLAKDYLSLPNLVQDTLIEASGAQKVGVNQTVISTESSTLSRHTFEGVEADRHLTIQIQFLPDQQPQIQLTRPGKIARVITLDTQDDTLKVSGGQGLLKIDLKSPINRQNWAGKWAIELLQPGSDNPMPTRVQVWAWNNFNLVFSQQHHRTSQTIKSEVNRVQHPSQAESLISLRSNQPGIGFKGLKIQQRTIKNTEVLEEAQPNLADIVSVEIETSRLDEAGDIESPHSPIISSWIQFPTPDQTEAVLVDLPVQIEGKDERGNPFTRLQRYNIIHLQPYSICRKLLSSVSLLIISAEVTHVYYRNNGEIYGLQLTNGYDKRNVVISSEILGKQLGWLNQNHPLENLPKNKFYLGVYGSNLWGIFRALTPNINLDNLPIV
ncbi:MAG: S8 family serine peptidase [Lyngbya sp.]|nr:S8 family serine peptidase [Lyngbya sp.]